MMSDYKAAIISFFLPLVSALIGLFMPVYDELFLKITIGLYFISITLYIGMLIGYKKKRKKNAPRIINALNLLLFCLFFTFPLMKVWPENVFIPILLGIVFFICVWLATIDQRSKTPLVLSDNQDKKGIWTYVFYAIPVIVIFVGGGGNFIVVREMHLTFGEGLMSVYGSVLLYILGCWLGFFMSSLSYKGLVLNGRLVK
ncbi:hypothetical protein ACFOZY_10410 [Chungangia koreensis]|uniref:Uncharacterized protein n=1 Tax=Chungangia koreensis TaxID=752657 RepID=A0ABV8X8Z5_9LACT